MYECPSSYREFLPHVCVTFRNLAVAALEVVRKFFPSGSRRDAALWHTGSFVIDPPALKADVEEVGGEGCRGHTLLVHRPHPV
jgi:hypothetical protein